MIPAPLARRAVAAARAFHQARLFQHLADSDVFALLLPGDDVPGIATILGQGGIEFGLGIYRGPQALAEHRTVSRGEAGGAHRSRCDMWSITIDQPGAVPPDLRTIAAAAGCNERLIPLFLVTPVGRATREPYAADLRRMILALRGVMLAAQRGLLQPVPCTPSGPARLLQLTVHGDERDLDVVANHVTLHGEEVHGTAPLPAPAELAQVPRQDAAWAVALRPVPAAVRGEEQRLFALLVADLATGELIATAAQLGGDAETAAQALYATCAGRGRSGPGLPRRIACTDAQLAAHLQTTLRDLGVEVTAESSLPLLDEIERRLGEHLHQDAGDDAAAPPDATGLTATRLELLELASQRREWLPDTVGPRTLYFGEDVDLEDLPTLARIAFLEWYLVHFRARSGRRTVAERMLQGDLAPPLRALLQAMVDTPARLWRVEEDRHGVLVLRDVFGEDSAEVPRPGLAASLEPGTCLPARVCDVGGDTLLSLLGPPLEPHLVGEALRFLAAEGFDPDADGIAAEPHMFGQLWAGLPDEDAPALQNSDGDPIRPQRATFVVADADVLRRALAARLDVEPQGPEANDHWVWFRENPPRRTLLARLELIGEELLVVVNSPQRLQRIRGWLDQVAGVALLQVQPIELAEVVPPGMSVAAAQAPAAAAAELMEMLRAHYRQWLDDPLPALAGQTPRQAASSREGRDQVARMIRTIPPPGGLVGVAGPMQELRRELLAELGLGQGEAS